MPNLVTSICFREMENGNFGKQHWQVYEGLLEVEFKMFKYTLPM